MADDTPVLNATGATVTAATKDIGGGVQAPKVFPIGPAGEQVLPTSLGAKTGATSLSVVPASDGFAVAGDVASGSADSGNPVKVGARYNSTLPTFTNGQRGDLQVGTRGSLNVQLKLNDSATAFTSFSSGSDALANTSLNGLNVQAFNVVFNGTTWDRLRGDTGGAYVNGAVASGATDAGNPVKVGARYNSTLPTLTDGQRGDLQVGTRGSLNVTLRVADGSGAVGTIATPGDAQTNSVTGLTSVSFGYGFNGTTWDRIRGDTNGLVIQPYSLTGSRIYYAAGSGGISNTATAVTMFASAGGSLRNYLTNLQIDAGTLGAATEIAIRDGAGGTVLWRGFIPTGGITRTIDFLVPLKGTAATLMEVVTLTATVTGSVYVNAQGYAAL